MALMFLGRVIQLIKIWSFTYVPQLIDILIVSNFSSGSIEFGIIFVLMLKLCIKLHVWKFENSLEYSCRIMLSKNGGLCYIQ